MERLRPVDTFGRLNGPEKLSALQGACEELERELGACKNTNALKEDISLFSSALNASSDQLPPYALEKFAKRLQALLKDLEARNRKGSVTRFKFRRKPTVPPTIGTTPTKTPLSNRAKPSDSSGPTRDQTLVVTHAAASYENLVHCNISYNARDRQNDLNSLQSGSSALSLRSLDSCIVKLLGVPFNRGSVYIENAIDSLVLIKIQSGADIQVRLFGLRNCKLYIIQEGMRRQAVILENCQDCCFHTAMKEGADIQDFSNISKCLTDGGEHFHFEAFDTHDSSIAALSN
ncbi:Tubulin-folding cofactor C [Lachancea thermotolerans]